MRVKRYTVRHSKGYEEGFDSLTEAEGWAKDNATGFFEILSYYTSARTDPPPRLDSEASPG